jgi:hypothetical protein
MKLEESEMCKSEMSHMRRCTSELAVYKSTFFRILFAGRFVVRCASAAFLRNSRFVLLWVRVQSRPYSVETKPYSVGSQWSHDRIRNRIRWIFGGVRSVFKTIFGGVMIVFGGIRTVFETVFGGVGTVFEIRNL